MKEKLKASPFLCRADLTLLNDLSIHALLGLLRLIVTEKLPAKYFSHITSNRAYTHA
jgi:hypothetical protein